MVQNTREPLIENYEINRTVQQQARHHHESLKVVNQENDDATDDNFNSEPTMQDINTIADDNQKAQQLPVLTVFLLTNLLQIVYLLVQTLTKIVLNSQNSLSAFDLAFFRSFYNLSASTVYLRISQHKLSDGYRSPKRWILLVRCFSGTLCFTMFVFAIKYLPLSIFFVVMNACPFIIAFLSCIWLHENITFVEVMCMIGAFGGIILVGISKKQMDSDDEASKMEAGKYKLGLLFALVTCIGQAVTMTTTRRIKEMSVFVIQWFYALMSTLTTGIGVWVQEKPFLEAFRETTWQIWLMIVALSILNNLGQNLATYINQRANPATVGIMSYAGIGFSFLIDIFAFKLEFIGLEVLGVCICLIFSLATAIYKHQLDRNKSLQAIKDNNNQESNYSNQGDSQGTKAQHNQ